LLAGESYARRRTTVEAFLRERSVELADLYRWAGALLEDRRADGWPHMVAHVGRELMNRLADYLGEVPLEDSSGPPAPTRPEEISRRLSDALAGDDHTLRAATQGLVEAIARAGEATEQRAAALVVRAEAGEDLDEGSTAAWARAWRILQRRFASWAHLRGPASADVSEVELERAWRELTDLLATRVAREPFFDSMGELLELAHRADPDTDDVRAALARMRPGTKARFYAELDDPQWVDRLVEEGAFAHPPSAIREEGTLRFPHWPEGLVLLRFAQSAPESVARAAVAVPTTDNARVAQLLAATAVELPAELVAERGLASRIARDLGGNARLLDVAEPAGTLARRLAGAGRARKALKIFEALLGIDYFSVPSGSALLPNGGRGRYRHDEYLVDRTARAMLPDLVAADPPATVKMLTRLLRNAQRHLSHEDSTRWRDAVRDTRSPFGDDPRNLLLELLREACATLAARGDEERGQVVEHLEAEESVIFERLRLHLLSELPDETARRRAALVDPDTLFSRERLGEVYRLLPVGFADTETGDRAGLLNLIRAGPAPERLGLPAEEHEGATDEVEAWQDEWRQRLLSAVEPLLGADDRERLDHLRTRRGRLDQPDLAGVPSASWIGPTSPVAASALGAMGREELVNLLRDFVAERYFAVPTPTGLGRELGRAAESDPAGWTWLAERLNDLPPLYVRGWLTGLTAAVRGGSGLPDADRVLAAIAWVLEQNATPDEQGGSLDEDVDFYGSQRAAADLMIEVLDRDQLTIERREEVWTLVRRLATDPDPTVEREASTEAEPMQLAFSALRPLGATAVLRYLQWLDGRLAPGTGPGALGFAGAPETQSVLEQLLDSDQSEAVRAALAAEIPLLVSVDRGWLAQRADALADPGGDSLARCGWSAYLSYAGIYGTVTTLLADSYRQAVAALAEAPPEIDDVRRRLADHGAVIWRDLPNTVPTLLNELLAVAPDADCARVMATLGRALHGALSNYEPSCEDLARHRALWDARLADEPGPLELWEFGWWWSSGRLRKADDLRRLAKTLRAARARIGDVRNALKLVDELVAADPALAEAATGVLEALAEARTAESQHIDRALLAHLLTPGLADSALQERATALVHSFGEQGYLTLGSLLA